MENMSKEQLKELLPRIHEQHEYLAQLSKENFYRPFAYSKALPIPPRFPWPDLPVTYDELDRMLGECLYRLGVPL